MSSKQILKRMVKPFYRLFRVLLPGMYYHMQYYRASRKMGDLAKESEILFNDLVENNKNKKCLQVGVKEKHGAKFGTNWISVDKYDTRDFIDYHYDITDMEFDDNEFDVAVCLSILEHVPFPNKAISELHRVLKPGGIIWVQLPFHYPYHESPHDFWRASPDGLRVWLKDFDETLCGSVVWSRTSLATTSFFCGTKRIT